MYALFIVLTIIASLLLIGVVLIQKSKGGGLSSSFAGSNQIMGVRRTNDFIEKATWTLAAIICVLSIASVFVMPRNLVQQTRVEAAAPQQTQAADFNTQTAPAPAAQTPAAPVAPAPAAE
ncbi:MAG: preprotein translocase subunit SecG [Pseudoflavonifractor sp.]|nr:preprotein translocase subunit SecG [Pseudoflavonifractor sp.]